MRKIGVTELGRSGLLSSIGGYLYHTTPFLINNLLKMCYKINCLKSLKVATSLNFPDQHRTTSLGSCFSRSHISSLTTNGSTSNWDSSRSATSSACRSVINCPTCTR